MQPSNEAMNTLREIVDDTKGASIYEIDEMFYGKGVCFACGAEHEGSYEPDAQYCKCDNCGADAVFGLELAITWVLP